jgi:hypothetical protein
MTSHKSIQELTLRSSVVFTSTAPYPRHTRMDNETTWGEFQGIDTRKIREGWPLLTVDRANGDSWSTYERDPSLVGSLGLSCWVQKILPLPWLL